MSDDGFPEWLLPDEDGDVETSHYRAIAEWTYLHDASPEDKEVIRAAGAEWTERLLDSELIDLGDHSDIEILWRGWELATYTIAAHLTGDCLDPNWSAHLDEHLGRALRFSAIVLMAATNDLIDDD